MEQPASRAEFPPRGARTPPAHSIEAWPVPGPAEPGQSAAAAVAGPAEAPASGARHVLAPEPGLAQRPAPVPGPRRDTAEPAEPADSMELPRPFCLWILKCSDHVWNVFSCCFQPLPISFTFSRNTIPGTAAANLLRSVTYSPSRKPHLYGRESCTSGRSARAFLPPSTMLRSRVQRNPFQTPKNPGFEPKSSPNTKEKITHGSKGWY
jgi:hypothetical protein